MIDEYTLRFFYANSLRMNKITLYTTLEAFIRRCISIKKIKKKCRKQILVPFSQVSDSDRTEPSQPAITCYNKDLKTTPKASF